jgi:hypothetical protein
LFDKWAARIDRVYLGYVEDFLKEEKEGGSVKIGPELVGKKIRCSDFPHPSWNEVLAVGSTSLFLRNHEGLEWAYPIRKLEEYGFYAVQEPKKPSERIREIVNKNGVPDPMADLDRFVARAIIQYLDEEWEKAQKGKV